jgi:hypothetical protein
MQNGKNNAKLNKVPSKFSPSLGENDGKLISTWNFGTIKKFSYSANGAADKILTLFGRK